MPQYIDKDKVAEIDRRIERRQKADNAKLRKIMSNAKDFPMTK